MSPELLEKEDEILNNIFIGSTKKPYDTIYCLINDKCNLELVFTHFQLISDNKSFTWNGKADQINLPKWFNPRAFNCIS